MIVRRKQHWYQLQHYYLWRLSSSIDLYQYYLNSLYWSELLLYFQYQYLFGSISLCQPFRIEPLLHCPSYPSLPVVSLLQRLDIPMKQRLQGQNKNQHQRCVNYSYLKPSVPIPHCLSIAVFLSSLVRSIYQHLSPKQGQHFHLLRLLLLSYIERLYLLVCSPNLPHLSLQYLYINDCEPLLNHLFIMVLGYLLFRRWCVNEQLRQKLFQQVLSNSHLHLQSGYEHPPPLYYKNHQNHYLQQILLRNRYYLRHHQYYFYSIKRGRDLVLYQLFQNP